MENESPSLSDLSYTDIRLSAAKEVNMQLTES